MLSHMPGRLMEVLEPRHRGSERSEDLWVLGEVISESLELAPTAATLRANKSETFGVQTRRDGRMISLIPMAQAPNIIEEGAPLMAAPPDVHGERQAAHPGRR
jgi:hypothetical protein